MADGSMENNCGCLYFYSKKGISQPCYLTRGKTSVGSSLECHIRIKGVEDIFCILDSNDAGFTVLVNIYEDRRILVNGAYAQKYTVLSHEDEFQLGDKQFKYCRPDGNHEDLELLRKRVAERMLVENIKRQSEQPVISPLKRLQRLSPKRRRFSTGSRISRVKDLPKVSERNISLSDIRVSTPLSASKVKFSQRMSKPRHSALGALKENEISEFQNQTVNFVASPISANDRFSKMKDTPETEFKSPTVKKDSSTSGNLKELDLNSTVSSCCSPVPTRRKMYSGNLSDVSDFTTPENNISAVSITPLNVSKKTNKSVQKSKDSLAYSDLQAESSTPKSAIRGRRSSAMYRPIVEEITPVSPGPRSSLRISSLKKPSFTQRRSVNFSIPSSLENSSLDSTWIQQEESFAKGTKRKRTLSDISGLACKKKIAINTTDTEAEIDRSQQQPGLYPDDTDLLGISALSDRSLNASGSDTESHENSDTSPGKDITAKSWRFDVPSPNANVPKITLTRPDDSDCEEICVSFVRIDSSGRNVVDNSYFETPAREISKTCSDRKSSLKKCNASDCYTNDEAAETSKMSTRNYSMQSIDSSFDASTAISGTRMFEVENDVLATSFDDVKRSSRTSISSRKDAPEFPDDRNSRQGRKGYSFSLGASRTPKKSVARRSIKRPISEERDSLVHNSQEKGTDIFIASDKIKISRTSNNSTKAIISPWHNKHSSRNSTFTGNNTRENYIDRNSQLEGSEVLLQLSTSRRSTGTRSIEISVSEEHDSPVKNGQEETADVLMDSDLMKTSRTSRNSIEEKRSVNQPCADESGAYNEPDSSFALSSSDISTQSEKSSRNSSKIDKISFLDESLASIADMQYASVESTLVSTRSSTRRTSVSATSNIFPERVRSNMRSKSLNLTSMNPKSVTIAKRKRTKSLHVRRSERSISVSVIESVNSPIKAVKCHVVPSSPSEASISTRATYGSRKTSSERSSIESSITEVHISFPETNTSALKRSKKSLHDSRRRSSAISTVSLANSPKNIYISDRSTRNRTNTPGNFKLSVSADYFASEKSTVGENINNKSLPNTRRASLGIHSTPLHFFPNRSARNFKNRSVERIASPVESSSISDKSSLTAARETSSPSTSEPSKTSNSISFSFLDSSIDDRMHESFSRRSSRKSRPSIDAHIYEIAKPKSSKVNSSTRKSKNESLADYNMRKLMQTPLEPKSPILEGVGKMFRTPLSKDPTDITATETAFHKFLETSKKTPEVQMYLRTGKSSVSKDPPSNNFGGDPTDITRLRRLLRTPHTPTPSKNKVEQFADTPNIQNSPKNTNTTTERNELMEVAGFEIVSETPNVPISPKNDLTNLTGIEKPMETPKEQNFPINELTHIASIEKLMTKPKIQNVTRVEKLMRALEFQSSPKNNLTDVAGVKKLMTKPKVQSTPKNDLTDVAGIKKLKRTPKVQNAPENDLSDVAGVKMLMRTPKVQNATKNELTHLAAIKKLMRTPKVQNAPKNDLTDVAGVKKIMKTPKLQNAPNNDLTDVVGVKKLMRTPKVQNEPRNDLTDVTGVKKIMKTPKVQNAPNNDLTDVAGVKKLMRTPKVQNAPNNDLTDVDGVKELMRTPKVQNTPNNDLTDVDGVKELMKTPRVQNAPNNDLTDIDGVKKLMKTPKVQNAPKNDLTDLVGVKKLMRTPKVQNVTKNDLTDVDGVQKLMKTPKVQNAPKNDLTDVVGVKKLMRTPNVQNAPNNDLSDVAGVKRLMKTPKVLNAPNNYLADVAEVKKFTRTTKLQPKNDLTYEKEVKKLVAVPEQQKSPENDMSDIRRHKRLLSPTVQKGLNSNSFLKVLNASAISDVRSFNESADKTFDNLLKKKPPRTYGKSPKKRQSNENIVDAKNPSENTPKINDAYKFLYQASLSSRKAHKQLYDTMEELNSTSDLSVKATSTPICVEIDVEKSNLASGTRTRSKATNANKLIEKSSTPTELNHAVSRKRKDERTPIKTEADVASSENNAIADPTIEKKENILQENAEVSVTDELKKPEPKTRKGKKTIDKTTTDLSRTNLRTKREKDILQEEVNVTNVDLKETKPRTRRGKKNAENIIFGERDDTSDNDSRCRIKTKNANVNVQEKIDISKAKKPRGIVKYNVETSVTDLDDANEAIGSFSDNNSNITAKTKKLKNIVKYNVETSETDIEVKKEIITRRGRKESKKTENDGDDHNISSDIHKVTKSTSKDAEGIVKDNIEVNKNESIPRRGRKRKENDANFHNISTDINTVTKSITKGSKITDKDNVEVKKVETITLRGRKKTKKIESDDADSHNDTIDEDNVEVSVNNVETKITDEKRKKGKRNTKKTDNDDTKARDISSDNDTTKVSKAIEIKGTRRGKKETSIEDIRANEAMNIEVNKIKSIPRRGRKKNENYDNFHNISTDIDTVNRSITKGAKITDKDNIEGKKVEIMTLRGRKKTKKTENDDNFYKAIDKDNVEVSANNVETKITDEKKKTGKRNTRKTDNDDTEAPDNSSDNNTSIKSTTEVSKTIEMKKTRRNKKETSVEDITANEQGIKRATARNTRANRGQNKKYDIDEWDTPVKTSVTGIKKNVKFAEKIKLTSPVVVIDSTDGLRRSKRTMK